MSHLRRSLQRRGFHRGGVGGCRPQTAYVKIKLRFLAFETKTEGRWI